VGGIILHFSREATRWRFESQKCSTLANFIGVFEFEIVVFTNEKGTALGQKT